MSWRRRSVSRDPLLYLEDMLECAMSVLKYVENLDFNGFVANKMAYDAVLRNLEILGEASKNLPLDFRERWPNVEWRAISRLRDILSHHYFSLEDETIWDIVQNKIPPLLQTIQRILEEEK